MSVGADLLSIIKKIFIVSEELTRLSTEVNQLSRTVNEHDVRLAVIENTLSMLRGSSKLILPGR